MVKVLLFAVIFKMKTKNLFTTIKGSQMKWGVRQEDKTIQDKIIDSVYQD